MRLKQFCGGNPCVEDFKCYFGEHSGEKKKFSDRTDYCFAENNYALTIEVEISTRRTAEVSKPIRRSLKIIESKLSYAELPFVVV